MTFRNKWSQICVLLFGCYCLHQLDIWFFTHWSANNFHWAGKELWHRVSCQDGFENLFNIFRSPGIFLWTHNSLAKKCLLSLLTKEDMDLTELKWLAQYYTTIKNQTQDISLGILIQKAEFFLLHTILPSSSLSSTGDKTQRWKTRDI